MKAWLGILTVVCLAVAPHLTAAAQEEQRFFETIAVTAGIRLDLNTITPLAISPRLAGVWSFTENQSLRLAFGQAFRKPSYYESSMHITGVKGEPGFLLRQHAAAII